MRGDVTSYVRTCPVFQSIKLKDRPNEGLLQPLDIPTKKWARVTTDLVKDLLESNGYSSVAVFVDILTKMVHFALCRKEVTVAEYAKLFVDTVFRLPGIPEVIISDRDLRFFGSFWESFLDLLGLNLRSNIAFHPYSDGQSENMIQTIENFLRPYVEQHPHMWTD